MLQLMQPTGSCLLKGEYMNKIKIFLLLVLVVCSCDIDSEIPPPNLPPAVYGQLPTRSDIIKAGETVGAANVQIISYQVATGTSENDRGVNTDGGFQPGWWQPNVETWMSGNYFPTLTGVKVVYDETDNMHPNFSVKKAIQQLFENAGFTDTWYPTPFVVETITDNRWRLIPLPTYAGIINEAEQLGASNVKINLYLVFSVDFWSPPPISIPPFIFQNYHSVPSDSSFNGIQGNVGHTNPRMLRLSYEHPGLGSIITNNDVEEKIRELFIIYGFESIDVITTGTQISAGFPLPSFNQIRQAAEQAGAGNVQVSTYIANNVNVIPLNEGSRLANIPIIVEITYDGTALSQVNTNVKALFANFNNVHIGNNTAAAIPLPNFSAINKALVNQFFFLPSLSAPFPVYTANGVDIWPWDPGSATYNARICLVVRSDGTATTSEVTNARLSIIHLFNGIGFFNLDIVTQR